MNYFKYQWLSEENLGWYESHSNGFPSTNSAIEEANNWIKRENILRDSYPFRQFLDECFIVLLSNWSKERNPSFKTPKTFHSEPKIDTTDYTNAHKWWSMQEKIIKLKLIDKEYHCITNSQYSSNHLSEKDFADFIADKKTEFFYFQDFLNYCKQFSIVEFNKQSWKNSKCSCTEWKKNKTCNHVIAIAYDSKEFKWPSLDLETPQNRGVGRPKKNELFFDKNKHTSFYDQLIPNTIPNNLYSNLSTSSLHPSTSYQVISKDNGHDFGKRKIDNENNDPWQPRPRLN